jgi:hypothetical protein
MKNMLDGITLLPNGPGLYLIFNRCTGRIYVGQSARVRKRCSRHLSQLQEGNHPNYKMQRDATQHGVEYFCFAPLLSLPEPTAIQALGGDDMDFGYNLSDGVRWTAETRFREYEARLTKKGRYAYLPTTDRTAPINRLLLSSWANGCTTSAS